MAEDEPMSDCEETQMVDDGESPPKKQKKSSTGGASKEIQDLQRQKKAAVKSEDYAEALRLKAAIDALQERMKTEKAKPPAGAGSTSSAPKGKASTKRPLEQADQKEKPKPPAVEELSVDPFFGDQSPALLDPTCATTAEREAWRAVYHGNTDFFQEKIAGKLPLLCQRDVVSRQTALHLAIQKGSAKAVRTFAAHRHESRSSARMASMAEQGTGSMNPLALGFETGKVGAARGGKELNNALVDQPGNPEPLQEVIARTPLPSDFLQLLMSLDFITQRAYMRRGKIMNLGRGRGDPFACDLMECLEPAMRYGQLGVVQLVLKRLSSMGVGPGHEVAAGLKDMPDNFQNRSATAVLRFGGALTPIHIAAINPDATKLSELLKREPAAAIIKNEGGHQPVHFAAACAQPGPLKLLLSEWSADRGATGSVKRTPLHFAAAAGRAECVKVLMGGDGLGPGRSLLFTKEIRTVLMRQKANLKIGNDGICILSRLLVDLMSRIITDSKQRVEQQPKLGLRALHLATKTVLTGTLASSIAEKSGKLAGGKLGLPGLASELSRSLSQLGEGELERMFNSVDKDGNGKLEKAEIEAVFRAANMKLQKKQLTRIIKDMDSDGNGDVSLEEFSSWMEAGSTHAVALRRHLVVAAGAMGQADVAEAEAAEETDIMQGIDKLAFDARQFLQLCKLPGLESGDTFEQYVAYASAVLECACTKVLEVSANGARSQKKTSISPDHIMSSIRANEDLQGLYQADSVVMNSLLLQARDKDGCSALHLAAEAGHLACVQVLVSCGADVDAPGPDRKSALAIASERGHVDCVKALLDASAKIDLADKRKRTPLLLAVRAGQAVVASVLLNRRADADAADDSGNTIVHYAAAFGWLECVDLLNRGGAKLSCANAMKLAPITAALQKGHKTVFRRMLDLGIDVNFRDADGTTLLLGCLGTVNRLVHREIEFMMSRGADPSLASSSGTTPLHALASAKAGDQSTAYVPHPFEAERLRRVSGWAARPKKKEEVDMDSDEDQQPPAKRAKKADEAEELHELVHRRGFHQLTDGEREAVFRLGFTEGTWQSGDNPTVTWSSLSEATQRAAQTLGLTESTWAAVPVRIVAGMRGEDGTIPLESGMAVGAHEDGMVRVRVGGKEQSVHVSRVLLAEEDAEGVWSQTPHVTVAIARMFLEKGVAVDARDAQGCTPLMLALRSRYHDLALCLLERGADPNAEAAQADPAAAGAGSLPKPRPRRPIDEVQPGEISRSMNGQVKLLRELLSRGCKVQDPATEVDVSVVLRFLDEGQLKSAALLIEAGADLSADRTGQNAMHKIFAQVFAYEAQSTKSTMALSIAMQLLTSATWGVKLLSAWTREHPRVTPLYSLIQAFATRTYRLHPEEKAARDSDMRAELLLKLVEAAPSTVDLSKAYLPPPGKESAERPQGLLGLLCAADQPTEKSQALVVQAISRLCRRGASANASDGSPAALHSLAQRLGPRLAASEFAKVLLPLTDLKALMPGGLTLMTFLLRGYHSEHGGKDAEIRACVRMLLEGRCDPDAADSPPKPTPATKPLHAAAALRSEGLVSDLLLARADPCGINNGDQQRTPLHFAVASAPTGSDANFDIEDMLIQAKADPARQDSLGLSVLHFALAKAEDGSLTQFQGEWLEELQDPSEQMPRRKSWTKQAWPLICKRVDPIETISSLCVLPGVNVNAKDKRGMAPLHLAVLRGASICALKLISAGAILEELFESNSPLGLAMHRYPDLAVLLMQKGASTVPKVVLFGSAEINSELHTGEQETIFSLAIRQAALCVQSVRASYLGAAISSMDSGFPREQALTDTIASQQFVMLLTLIPKVGVEILRDMRSTDNQSLLHKVAACKDVKRRSGSAMQQQELLRKILSDGASMQEVQDPFLRAASKLLERGVLLTADSKGRTPLHLAAGNLHVDLVALMLECGSASAELVQAVDADGRTALGCGLGCGLAGPVSGPALRIASELIARGASARRAIVDVELRCPALSWCILEEAPPVVPPPGKSWVQVLFSGEAPDLTLLDKDGDSCLTMAASAPSYSVSYLRLIMRWAEAAGGDAKRGLLLGRGRDGMTALHLAVCKGNMGFVSALLEQAEQVSRHVLREMLKAKDSVGRTALVDAVQCSEASLWMVCLLLRWMDDETAAAVLPMADNEGHTALMYAVMKNDTKLVRALLAGRPSKPEDLQVKCPPGLMAGSPYMAALECGGPPGAVKYSSCSWLDDGGRMAAAPLLTRDADGWHSVDAFADPLAPAVRGALPNSTEVTCLEAGTARLLVQCHLGQVWVRRQDVYRKGAPPPALQKHSALQYSVKATIPAGVGPGVSFTITSGDSPGSPGNPGLAGSFAGEGASRVPASALGVQSSGGFSALHLCIQPLAFGSYENAEILAALVQSGASADLKDASGRTAVDLACSQQSGRMLRCLQELGVPSAAGRAVCGGSGGGLGAWPEAVDVAADSARALADAAEAAERRAGGPPEPPVERFFQKPSQASDVVVARGPDGSPLDLVMTKVDLSRGPLPQNVFYRMQVLHERNQNNYFLFTRWGMIGDSGQYQSTPFESLEKASADFCKIFKSKSGNDWSARANFEKKPLKYQLHDLKYPTVGVQDALQMDSWKRLPARLTPLPLRRLLNCGSSFQLLRRNLQQAGVEQPLGALKQTSLHEARETIRRLSDLLSQKAEEESKPEPSGARLQAIHDDIAAATGRLYELVPTKESDDQTKIRPVRNPRDLKNWANRISVTDDLACAARILLGAQSHLAKSSPTDYIFRAMGVRVKTLPCESAELRFIEQYINRSSPGECRLFSGEGAEKLPEKPKPAPGQKELVVLPIWQALEDVICYKDPSCQTASHAGCAVGAGSIIREYETKDGAICIKKRKDERELGMWVKPRSTDGTETMIRLSDRECASNVAAIYRVDRKGEETRAGGDTAQLLFHGSGMPNVLSILSQGLQVKPPGAQHAGSAFGNGIYFANAFSKSRGYCRFHNGIGYMLLCEVTTGRELTSSDFNFQQTVMKALLQVSKERLGLPADAKVDEHPALKEEYNNIKARARSDDIEDLTGLPYDSFHLLTQSSPDEQGRVQHPDGYSVPHGALVSRDGSAELFGQNARDEFVVYDTSRVRLRYVVELRDFTEHMIPVPKPEGVTDGQVSGATGGSDGGDGGQGDEDMGDSDESENEDADMSNEDDDE